MTLIRQMRIERKQEKFKGRIANQHYSNILFEELHVSSSHIVDSKFENIHFKNFQLGDSSTYTNCEFRNCKFWGMYSSLGNRTKYINCNFFDCKFTGVILFSGTRFYNCKFSGKIINAIIQDNKGGLFSKETVTFNDCDLSDMIFENISLYGKGFNNCILPLNGIRKFKNDNDTLIERAETFCLKIDSQDKIESKVIFDRNKKSGQNPIIIDTYFLDSFFKTSKSKEIFDSIVDGFEIYTD
jgi:uncharacterized protein YjbI with pentapeptide repeats